MKKNPLVIGGAFLLATGLNFSLSEKSSSKEKPRTEINKLQTSTATAVENAVEMDKSPEMETDYLKATSLRNARELFAAMNIEIDSITAMIPSEAKTKLNEMRSSENFSDLTANSLSLLLSRRIKNMDEDRVGCVVIMKGRKAGGSKEAVVFFSATGQLLDKVLSD